MQTITTTKHTVMSKLISLETAQSNFYPAPDNLNVRYADAFTLTSDDVNPLVTHINYWMKKQNFDAHLAFNEGYIYVLENKGQPGILKIGYTDRTPQARVKEINSGTGVITPWIIINAFACRAPGTIEYFIHKELESYRVNKEAFAVTPSMADECILRIIQETNSGL